MKKKHNVLKPKQERKFNEFDVINVMLFIGVIATFIISIIYSSINFDNSLNSGMEITIKVLCTILLFIPVCIKLFFNIYFPNLFYLIFYIFLFVCGILMWTFEYIRPIYLDKVFAFLSGILMCFFALFFVKYATDKRSKTSALVICLYTFCISLTIFSLYFLLINGLEMVFNLLTFESIKNHLINYVLSLLGCIMGAIICSICSYKYRNFMQKFKIVKLRTKEKITQIEE